MVLCFDESDVMTCSRDILRREYVLLDHSKAGHSLGPWMLSTRQQLMTTTIRYDGIQVNKHGLDSLGSKVKHINTRLEDGSLASPQQWLLVANITKR